MKNQPWERRIYGNYILAHLCNTNMDNSAITWLNTVYIRFIYSCESLGRRQMNSFGLKYDICELEEANETK